MKKIKIFLYGKHSNRTPFYYPEYRILFNSYFEYVSEPKKAEYLVTGFRLDFINNAEEIYKLKKQNSNLKLVVLSEEPLWDTLWSGDFQKPKNKIKCKINKKDVFFDYYVLNHVTSNIFDFNNIPYFITTNNDFYVRYNNLFSRNLNLTENDFNLGWRKSKIRYAFFAEKRLEEQYDVSYGNGSILGINRFRSLVAENLKADDVLREGFGWKSKNKRQTLVDWHLDKLATLDRNSYILSAIENTHLDNYISEKIFDSFSVQSVPIYYAQKQHRVFDIVEHGSFINLAGLSVEESIDKVLGFTPDHEFVDKYLYSQYNLSMLFSDISIYLNERRSIVNKVVMAFEQIKRV